MPTLLITGATGFVGTALVPALAAAGHRIVRIVREAAMPGDLAVPDLLEWRPESRDLAGVDCIIHLAARTHVMHESTADPLAAYRALNVGVATRLAAAAAQAGVRRFVFLSSIKVNGEATHGRAFNADDTPHPEDASALRQALGWQALVPPAVGLARMAGWYHAHTSTVNAD